MTAPAFVCLEERRQVFFSYVMPEPNSGCLLWTGRLNCRNPHKDIRGYFSINGKYVFAHRVAWLLSGRDIPDGQCVLHHCDVPICVNVNHLFLGDHALNARDKARKSRGRRSGNGLPFGVRVERKYGYIGAQVREGGTMVYLGKFATVTEAAEAAQNRKRDYLASFSDDPWNASRKEPK